MSGGGGSSGSGARGLWATFRWPLLLAALSWAGLLSALLGDGVWDAIGWLALAVPVGLCLRGVVQALRRA